MIPAPRLSDLLPAVAAALGSPLASSPEWDLPSASGYVVALVDGMGATLLQESADHAPFLSSLPRRQAVCGIPSTTATSLTSLGTGLAPAEHGIVGYTSRIPGTRRLLNALEWDKSIDPEKWQPRPTVFEQLARCGIRATSVGPKAYATSGLTRAGQRGAHYAAADRFGERLAAVVDAAGHSRSLTYVYDGDLDWTGHRHGVDSPQWRAQLRLIDASLEQMQRALPSGVRLIVTADHGMVDVGRQFDLDGVPELRDGVTLIGGEARFRHLYCESGRADDVARRWRTVIGADDAVVLTFEEARASGWFDEPSAAVRPRIGDVLVASLGAHAVMSSRDHPKEFHLVGLHGSITEREQAIPLLVC